MVKYEIRNCTKCGFAFLKGATFCSKCGTRINDECEMGRIESTLTSPEHHLIKQIEGCDGKVIKSLFQFYRYKNSDTKLYSPCGLELQFDDGTTITVVADLSGAADDDPHIEINKFNKDGEWDLDFPK